MDDKQGVFKRMKQNPIQDEKIRLDLITFPQFQSIYEKNLKTTMYSCSADLAFLKKNYDALLYRMIVIKFNQGIDIFQNGKLLASSSHRPDSKLEQGPESLYQNLINFDIV